MFTPIFIGISLIELHKLALKSNLGDVFFQILATTTTKAEKRLFPLVVVPLVKQTVSNYVVINRNYSVANLILANPNGLFAA